MITPQSTCRGLAGRLASAEDSLGCLIAGARGDRVDNRWIMLSRKREKLEAQLAEAIWIKNAIERKTPKVRIVHIYQKQFFMLPSSDRVKSAEARGRGGAPQVPGVPRREGAADLRQRRARGQGQAVSQADHRDGARTLRVPVRRELSPTLTLDCDNLKINNLPFLISS